MHIDQSIHHHSALLLRSSGDTIIPGVSHWIWSFNPQFLPLAFGALHKRVALVSAVSQLLAREYKGRSSIRPRSHPGTIAYITVMVYW